MEVSVKTKYNKGDRVRVMNPNDVWKKIDCPFCKGKREIDTGILHRPPRRMGLGTPERFVISCRNCIGGKISYLPAEPVTNVRKGIWEIVDVARINFVKGRIEYNIRLIDEEGEEVVEGCTVGYVTVDYEGNLIPEEAGFILNSQEEI